LRKSFLGASGAGFGTTFFRARQPQKFEDPVHASKFRLHGLHDGRDSELFDKVVVFDARNPEDCVHGVFGDDAAGLGHGMRANGSVAVDGEREHGDAQGGGIWIEDEDQLLWAHTFSLCFRNCSARNLLNAGGIDSASSLPTIQSIPMAILHSAVPPFFHPSRFELPPA